MEKPIVSIIIPTYNRSDLLGATLDSIRKQNFTNWECIVVDDGSQDYSVELMKFYCLLDSRIKFFLRPTDRKRGANSCRNYGFEVSSGKYIQWFDSDDLMVPDFLQMKIEAITENEVDYVISKSINFGDPHINNIISGNEVYYQFKNYQISHINYVTQKINWLTYDFMGKRHICKKIKFNEKLPSGQEFNYFCKLTFYTIKLKFIDEYLTLRRVHLKSIRGRFNRNSEKNQKEEVKLLYLETWKEISVLNPGSDADKYFVLQLIDLENKSQLLNHIDKTLISNWFFQKRIKIAITYLLYRFVYFFSGRGNIFRRNFLDSL